MPTDPHDVTELLNTYRECARDLWNTYFRPLATNDGKSTWDARDEFEDVCVQLFSTLVLRPVGHLESAKSPSCKRIREPLPFLRIVAGAGDAPIHVNRDIEPSGYWDHPLDRIGPDDADLRFIDVFDFDVLGFRDFAYYEVRIVASERHPEIVGRHALVEAGNVRVTLLAATPQ